MEDQGVVLGTALGLENMADRLRIQPVGPQTVDRLRGDAQKAPPPEDGGGGGHVLPLGRRVRNGKILCLHRRCASISSSDR